MQSDPCWALTDDVTETDSDEFLNRRAIKLLIEVDFIAKTERKQMHEESHELLLAHKIALITLAEDFVDNVLDDGALRREKEFVGDFRSPHFDG